jgi:enterochelin esterase-like enzyme
MQVIVDRARCGAWGAKQIVMLPAAYSSPEDFVRAGFIGAARARGLDLDLILPALELHDVLDRSLLVRVRDEFILPARARGCALWLGGISLGGYLALASAARHPHELEGLCLFAPYLGSHIVTGEIERAGSLPAWRPGEPAEDDEERRIWQFLQGHSDRAPALHLGLGREDRFAARVRLLAQSLPPQCVDIVPGGHDWPTWQRLWERFLDARFAPHAKLA